jgi:hypothetical protein
MTILRTWKLLWLLAAGLLLQPNAHAAGNCTVTSIAFTGVTYNNTALTATGTVNYTCSRSSNGTDGSPFTLQVTASDGLYYGSNTRNGGNGANRLAYNLSTTAAWGNGMPGLGNAHAVSVSFPTGNTDTVSGSFPFTFRIAASLNPLSGRTYTDTVAVGGSCATAPNKNTPCTLVGATLPISITVATTCSITSAPGTLNMAYTSFQSIAGTGNVPFSAQCSNGGPFRMSLSPTNGTLLGVAYTLRLGTSAGSATNISSTTTYNLTGTGSAVTYYVNATAASGQVGTCASGTCQALSPPHTLLIEY